MRRYGSPSGGFELAFPRADVDRITASKVPLAVRFSERAKAAGAFGIQTAFRFLATLKLGPFVNSQLF